MEELLILEQLLFLSVIAISGIHPNEDDYEPKEITDRHSVHVLYEIARRYQVYSYDISSGDRFPPLQKTVFIVRLCDRYFSMEYIWATRAIKIRRMEDLDFKAMAENEKKIFDRMDTKE